MTTAPARCRVGQGSREGTRTPAHLVAECFRLHAGGHTAAEIALATGVSRDVQRINRSLYDPGLPLLTEQTFPIDALRNAVRRRFADLLEDPDRQGVEEIIERTGLSSDDVKRVVWAHKNDLTLHWTAADRLAVGFGFHPSEVWGDSWID